ncbi:MAG: flavodoxin domain-containing protein [Candidatus Freyarchaeota archaeon]
MPGKKVLIAYGTRYGSTEEISQEMGKTLEKEGLEVQLVDLKKTKSKEWPSLEPFDGVLVGSSIAVGKWMNEPQEFLKKHKAEIKKKEKIRGIFVSCGSAWSIRALANLFTPKNMRRRTLITWKN